MHKYPEQAFERVHDRRRRGLHRNSPWKTPGCACDVFPEDAHQQRDLLDELRVGGQGRQPGKGAAHRKPERLRGEGLLSPLAHLRRENRVSAKLHQ